MSSVLCDLWSDSTCENVACGRCIYLHKKELAKLKKVWNQAKLQADAKQKEDAVAKAHGEPITMLTSDWTSLMNQFKQKYGMSIHETRLPGQLYFEAYEHKCADGPLYPETPAQFISLAEEKKQKASKPEVSSQMGLHLDNTLTIQTTRFISSVPSTIGELRNRYQVMTHMWLVPSLPFPSTGQKPMSFLPKYSNSSPFAA